jgi:hypothetical protein
MRAVFLRIVEGHRLLKVLERFVKLSGRTKADSERVVRLHEKHRVSRSVCHSQALLPQLKRRSILCP